MKYTYFAIEEADNPWTPSRSWFWMKWVHAFIRFGHWGGSEASQCPQGSCPVVSTGNEWVAGGSVTCQALLRTKCSHGLSSVSLMKVENFWLWNESCRCWEIKGLCLKCRSSWRPVGLRRAVEKNVCLIVTHFAYSTMSWEGRLTRGKKKSPFVLTQNLLNSWDF